MADASQVQRSIVKAFVIGDDSGEKDIIAKAESQSDDDPSTNGYLATIKIDVVEPPFPLDTLVKIYEQGNSLRQNIDAYKTNIDGFGHIFEPVIQLDGSGVRDAVSEALLIDRRINPSGDPIRDLLPPTDEEIDAKITELKSTMRYDKAIAKSFFENCVVDESFVALRGKTREDVEATGNGYWEVIRNDAYRIAQFDYMPSRSVRVAKKKSKMLSVMRSVRVGALSFRTEVYRRKFRRYVQVGGDKPVYFKEFEDPTIVSNATGEEFASVEELMRVEPEAAPANEVIHFKVHSIRTGTYGVPRWVGNMLSVLGSRSAEEVNFAYFENKGIPPIAILVSGGELGTDSVARIQDYVEVQLKGKKNFHKILVIEATATKDELGLADNRSPVHIEIKQLTDAQLKDGLFQNYDAANMDKVGMSFRMPRLLRGDIRDFNRSSAQAALVFAESQVFLPMRNEFDFGMNHFILPALDVKTLSFKSNGPQLSDAEDWGDMIAKLTVAGILTPADARDLASKLVLNRDLPQIKADWTNQPLALTIAGVQADDDLDGSIPLQQNPSGIPNSADPANLSRFSTPDTATQPNLTLIAAAKARLLRKAKELLQLRDAFRDQEAKDVVAAYQQARKDDATEVFNMTFEELESKFGIKPKPQ